MATLSSLPGDRWFAITISSLDFGTSSTNSQNPERLISTTNDIMELLVLPIELVECIIFEMMHAVGFTRANRLRLVNSKLLLSNIHPFANIARIL